MSLVYYARDGQIWRVGIGPIPDAPITDDEAETTRLRHIRWSNRAADAGDFNEAENAEAIVNEIHTAQQAARLWREQGRKVA